jgi:ATPase subunit of ABC transporter with duplicated ATPase domains
MTQPLLQAQQLDLNAPGGRPLFRELNLQLGRGERVAVVGRNGVGKSSLLQVLAGEAAANGGKLACSGQRLLVPQGITSSDPTASPGELRRRSLQAALEAAPDLLLLDEPTHDLDQASLGWLQNALRCFENALIVVTHDRRLLREFQDFFLVAESGCRYFHGSCEALLRMLEREQYEGEQRYLSELTRLTREEKHHFVDAKRAERKKNVGRVRELKRSQSRMRLNTLRGTAQQTQARRAHIHEQRRAAARDWVEAARRSLAVDLPLEAVLPQLPEASSAPVTQLQEVTARARDRTLFQDLSLALGRERLAVTGPNASGKSTLLELLAGVRRPQQGQAHCEPDRIGYIAQNGANWCSPESLLQVLVEQLQLELDAAASCMRAHRFPFALAERPLASLSPGERLRAALICILQRPSPPELLILDEPTSHLDFLGYDSLHTLLSSWRGGLVVSTHDQELLHSVRFDKRLALTKNGSCTLMLCHAVSDEQHS